MPLIEAVTIEVGAAIAKSILKLWMHDSKLGEDISSSIIDLLKAKTSDVFAQRRGERQFEEIGDQVGEALLPLFELEGACLDEGDCRAVALAVAEAFNTSRLSSELLTKYNLDPTTLAKYVLGTHPNATEHFSTAATEFYERIIKESCVYIVNIASKLPSFTEQSFAAVLKREDQIIAITKATLEELRKMREHLDPMVEGERFERDYREAVARNLNVLYLVGAEVSRVNRRHQLSVAYITLSVQQRRSSLPSLADISSEVAADETDRDIIPVDVALARSQRLLLRGVAGSGKTTLLQWIAVRAATRSFEEDLADWNESVPFYIRLRKFVQDDLPRPEAFPGLIAPMIADTMPRGWVHTILKSGRAIVLIDGVDEIPASRREDVHTWLNDLFETYSEVRFIITSRPYAIEEGWLDSEAFRDAELQPMEISDIYTFVDHWHNAVREELHTDEEKNELGPLAEHLKEQIKHHRPIYSLATSPLLCAMLCALNRERRQQLPVNRIELYKACCSLLLERRDKESRVDLSDYPPLNYNQKLRLLEDLAYQMLKEDLSEIAVTRVDESFARKLANMPNVPPDTSAEKACKFFVERAGILREPAADQIDFTHRTFQEFFAAQAALDAAEIEVLVANAHDDHWREVILLAAGLASRQLCEQLVQGLIYRGDRERKKKPRSQLHLLTVSLLETSVELAPELQVEVEKRLSKLVPPTNMAEAQAIAAAGTMAVKYLGKKVGHSAATAAACVRALVSIGGDAALEKLKEYASDQREAVVEELLKGWDSFDRKTYARRILSQALRMHSTLCLERISSLEGIQYLTSITTLDLLGCLQLSDLSLLVSLPQLTCLHIQGSTQLKDISPLAGLSGMTSLMLSYCSELKDLSPLAGLSRLTSLDLSGCSQLADLSVLVQLPQLTSLNLANLPWLRDLSVIASLTQLTSLDVSRCPQVRDLSVLANLTRLTSLNVSRCPRLSDLSVLAQLPHLTSLNLSRCPQVRDLSVLAQLPQLIRLNLAGCSQLTDLSVLAKLPQLTSLNLSRCSQLSDLSVLVDLSHLKELSLCDCFQLSNLKALEELSSLEEVRLSSAMREKVIIPESIKPKIRVVR